jgi:hypothetical protein
MNRRDAAWLAGLALVFLVWHVPLMFRTETGQDEHWFGVTGTTIVRTGLPQIPYLPSRDPAEVCYKSDVALYVLPPLSFYLQALVNVVLGHGIGQARLASTIEGLVAAWLVYCLALYWFGDRRGAIFATLTYLFSRAFYFPATTARPDMAASMFGLLAVWCATLYRPERRRRLLALSGIAIGLSLLSHPFGIVPAVQVGISILAMPGSFQRRVADAAILTALALAVFALWLPLIALHPDLFRIQFFGNVVNRAGPGLGSALRTPWGIVSYQGRQIWGHLGAIQTILFALGIVWSLFQARRSRPGRAFLYHLVASITLLILFEGRHPTLGYYAYPAAFASIAVGMLASTGAAWIARTGRFTSAIATALVALVLSCALLPGAGLRAVYSQWRHIGDRAYDAHAVARTILADIPPDRLVAVDCPYVIDFYLTGRPVVAATVYPMFFDVRREPFEYVVLGRIGLGLTRDKLLDLELIRTYGDPADPFAPYAELYRRVPVD